MSVAARGRRQVRLRSGSRATLQERKPPMSEELSESDPRYDDLAAAVAVARVRAGLPEAASRTLPDKTGQIDTTVVAFNVFANLMATSGLRDALYSLLRLTDYRFISIFRFRDGLATSAVHVDRENLTLTQADEVPDTATYCCYVRDGNGAFTTADALIDARTAAHPARAVVRAYCGIPVLDVEGELIGTLCHYDLVPRDPAQLDLELLLQAASLIAQSGQVPSYPERA